MTIDTFTASAGYKQLSNFWLCDVKFEGIIYPSSEHAYMASKTPLSKEREMILACKTCIQAKNLGQTVTLRPGWEDINPFTSRPRKVDFMHEILFDKFTRNDDLCEFLLSTGDEHLIERNNWGDRFWGVCKGRGLNWLGRTLMNVRELLRPKEL